VYGLRLAMQALYFLLLARWLGVHQFGTFSGIWVLCGFLATLSGLGFPVLVFRATALDPAQAANCAARGLRTIALTALPLSAVFIGICLWKFPATPSIAVLAPLAVSEIVLVPVLSLLSSVHQGHERLGRSHIIFATLGTCRLVFLLLLVWRHTPDLPDVIWMHTFATTVTATAWLFAERKLLASPLRTPAPEYRELVMGLYFALSGTALIAYTELNQSIVLALTGAVAAGLLAVAYKVVVLLSAPLTATCQAIAPRLIRAAHEGGTAFRRMAIALAWPLLLYALASGVLVFLASGLVTFVFGSPYAGAEQLVRQLCVLPVFIAVRLLAAYVLMAMSSQRNRVIAELGCLVVSVSINFYLISRYGLKGAIAAILIAEALTACVLASVAWRMSRHTHMETMRIPS
jgi:O-antigen/teichoic acid export membrane protein